MDKSTSNKTQNNTGEENSGGRPELPNDQKSEKTLKNIESSN